MIIEWIKWLFISIVAVIMFFGFMFTLEKITYQEPVDKVECKYTITMTAWYGQAEYCANKFTIDGNTYLMYNSHDELISTVTAQDGYCIEAELTK